MSDIKEAHEKARGAARDAGQLYFPEVLEAMLSAYLASLETSGFVIAPVEATEEMLRDGGANAGGKGKASRALNIYMAMLASRPRLTDGGTSSDVEG